jgi:transposase
VRGASGAQRHPEELQRTLALVETLTKQHQEATNKAKGQSPSSEKNKKPRKPRQEHGPTAQPDLPSEERSFELDEPDRVCPCCGGELCPITGQFEESEMIDVIEVSYRVVKIKQQKYNCRCGGALETAPGPERATKGGRYSLDFAIKIALDKYLDHIPLARQEHVFRKFEEAEPNHPEANLALGWIGELYAIDARAGDDVERRRELRRTESAAVLAKFKTWLWSQAVLKTLSIGKAAAYTIANWERLTRFVENPLVPLDNNGTERGIRGPVVGRKNHYGSKSKRGTEVAATFYSLLETAKLHDVDPAHYLREAVRAADRGEVLLPAQLVAAPS